MDATDWLLALAHALEVEPPSEAEIEALLELAGVAAHSSERIAAPVSCWLAARAGVAPAAALAAARQLADDVSAP